MACPSPSVQARPPPARPARRVRQKVVIASLMAQPCYTRLIASCDAGGLPVAYPGAAAPAILDIERPCRALAI